ncbi:MULTISPECIES: DUF2304 domain-containing protein [Rothia]|jgi:hypothetical protein|uniref:DUF2304 domain-containing protein n=1 Tax=Rothia TaxID=32207 RepID=UPI00066E2BF9|nr:MULTISPECIES: DUF2304 domain-containing protein [Rothia]OFJ74001.1 hypothetical protein HMPREF2845_00395 [Rothia sp. HMSC065B04]OFJ78696.1 hypothetical protein HMPREF2842_06915 [Rothia sp. HMSC069C10]OFL52153.1 hypothetical protein HMPREF2765_08200 [Rothia sp. HMSC062H08]OFL77687.1 hypothetical protein HMPREF2749_04470 [Rothia sp. HMSC075F09]OFN73513.1 hypothetical protein HMPREF2528_03195 [Rothia sp. HMSC078H08]
MSASVFFLILSVLVCAFVIVQVRHQRMKERYAALWLIIGAVIIVLGAFPSLLNGVADFVGVALPVNLLFLLSILLLMGVSIHLTLELSRLSEKTRILAEEVAILKALQEQPEGASGLGRKSSARGEQ